MDKGSYQPHASAPPLSSERDAYGFNQAPAPPPYTFRGGYGDPNPQTSECTAYPPAYSPMAAQAGVQPPYPKGAYNMPTPYQGGYAPPQAMGQPGYNQAPVGGTGWPPPQAMGHPGYNQAPMGGADWPPPQTMGGQPRPFYPTNQGVNMVVQCPIQHGKFDAGARFSPHAPPSVPPPPPGCIPNSSQLSVMQGQAPAQVKQKKGGFWNGTGSGGFTFW